MTSTSAGQSGHCLAGKQDDMASDYVSDLEAQLCKINEWIDRSAKGLDLITVEEKTHALSEMTCLRQQHDILVTRIAEAKAKGAEHRSALHMSFQ